MNSMRWPLGLALLFIGSAFAQDQPDEDPELLKLARKHFDRLARDPEKNWNPALTPSEEKLICNTAAGRFADYSPKHNSPNYELGPQCENKDDPACADEWPDSSVLRADVIAWLCTDKHAKELMPHNGIQIWGARIEGKLDLEEADLPFQLVFIQCRIIEDVRLSCARVKGLYWDGSHVASILADGLKVADVVLFRNGFTATGQVRLLSVEIGARLECGGAKFLHEGWGEQAGLVADGAKIKGDVFFRHGFEAKGQVSLQATEIGGSLYCDGAKFLCENWSDCLIADGLKVNGSVYFRERAEIHGTASFVSAKIDGFFRWHGLERHENTELWLQSAHVGTLRDEKASWPGEGKLKLDGFTYDRVDENAPLDVEGRLMWLRLDRSDRFNPQPYEQLASVLKRQGHEEDAKNILVGKEQDWAAHELRIVGNETEWQEWKIRLRRVVHGILGATVDYGYRPLKALWWALGICVLGLLLFKVGQWLGVMTPVNDKAYLQSKDPDWSRLRRRHLLGMRLGAKALTKSPREISADYPKFRAWVYSIDEFAPLVNLRQGDFWIPNLNRDVRAIAGWRGKFIRTYGRFLRIYLPRHIASGWILSTLSLAGLTGLVQR
ncbi:MAG: hypothetical protein AABZ47_18335 [Planctomycetota bacterium]